MRSGLINVNNLLYKYTNELHANEIVLLAYYIATINIEETFHDLMHAQEYMAFEGIVLTDTFALSETVHTKTTDNATTASISNLLFQQNSKRAIKQLEAPITVIVGNPPYSVGQKSGNDNNQNVSYEYLDSRLANTYVAKSKATLNRNVYDTYIKAFRWATDRLGENGVIGFVSNGAYLDSVALDGFIRYYDIGDSLTREQKLEIIKEYKSIKNIPWKYLTPNANNDWINQRNPNFMNFIALCTNRKRACFFAFRL